MKKLVIIMLIGTLVVGVVGCLPNTGTSVSPQPIKIVRTEFVRAKNAENRDMSAIQSFVTDMNSQLPDGSKISNYEIEYDKDTDTFYLYAENGVVIAFKLDTKSDNVLFASVYGGEMEDRGEITKTAAKTLAGTNSELQDTLKAIEYERWLIQCNNKDVQRDVSGFSMDAIDTSKPYAGNIPVPTVESPTVKQTASFQSLLGSGQTTIASPTTLPAPTLPPNFNDVTTNDISARLNATPTPIPTSTPAP